MPTLLEVETTRMTRPWRASMVILCAHFRDDARVWSCVVPGESIDLRPLLHERARALDERVLLAVAQSFHDPDVVIPAGRLTAMRAHQLRTLLDALAIARGSLPID